VGWSAEFLHPTGSGIYVFDAVTNTQIGAPIDTNERAHDVLVLH